MVGEAVRPPWEINDFIEAFEGARRRDATVDLAEFLPQADHPYYPVVLRELIRVDLEYSWEQGQPTPLEEYRRLFPALFADAQALRDIAFEEFRLRVHAGQKPTPLEYQQRYGVDIRAWPNLEERARKNEGTPLPVPSYAVPQAESWSATALRDPAQVQWLMELEKTDPRGAEQVIEGFVAMPEVGDLFLDFQLVAELGRGAFGRVFLARQRDLAHRPVALKVTVDLLQEDQKLAQLQHTNVVPIYSAHRAGTLQAVCMPYFGAATLADVLQAFGHSARWEGGKSIVALLAERRARLHEHIAAAFGTDSEAIQLLAAPEQNAAALAVLASLSHVDAVLLFAERLADGLAHAHERGILHRDLKPANILITDDGQPMLLDFNIASDIKKGVDAGMGGTLPYMAPELLESFQDRPYTIDARSDLYAFGVILYEALTGRLPYEMPTCPLREALPRMAEQRRQPPQAPRRLNPAISPALQAIVLHCLQHDPQLRYPSARALRDDLRRQREHRPLQHVAEPSLVERGQKWWWRHPRVRSPWTVAALGAVLFALGLVAFSWWSWQRQNRQFVQFQEHLPAARRLAAYVNLVQLFPEYTSKVRADAAKEAARCKEALKLFEGLRGDMSYLPEDRQESLTQDGQDMAYFLARWDQVAEGGAPKGAAKHAGASDDNVSRRSARDYFLAAWRYCAGGDIQKAAALLGEATGRFPEHLGSCWLLGLCQYFQANFAEAAQAFKTCLALDPDFAWAHFLHGLTNLQLQHFDDAERDFSSFINHRDNLADAYFHRAVAVARQKEKKLYPALRDLDKALALDPGHVEAFHARWQIRRQTLNDELIALNQKELGKLAELKPTSVAGWTELAVMNLENRRATQALADLEQALHIQPDHLPALLQKSNALLQLGQSKVALEVLNELDARFQARKLSAALDRQTYVHALLQRGELHASLGQRSQAQEDAEACYNFQPSPEVAYRAACIYAKTCELADIEALTDLDVRRAVKLLSYALRSGYMFHQVKNDNRLASLRRHPEYQKMVDAVDLLGAGPAPHMRPKLVK